MNKVNVNSGLRPKEAYEKKNIDRSEGNIKKGLLVASENNKLGFHLGNNWIS